MRRILGSAGEGISDQRLEHMRDELERVAGTLYDEIARLAQTECGPDAIRWGAYTHTATEEEFWDWNDTSRVEMVDNGE